MKRSASYRAVFLILAVTMWAAVPAAPSYGQYEQNDEGFAGIEDPRQADLERPDARQEGMEQGDLRQQEIEGGDLRQEELEEPSRRQEQLDMGDQRQYDLEH